MKNIIKLLTGFCISSSLVMSSCIEETFPTNGATEDQIISSDQSASAMLWGMHAMLNTPVFTVGDYHFDWGYGAMMHIRDIQTNDMPIYASNYDQFQAWERNISMGEDYLYNQIVWNFYWRCVLSANKLLAAFPIDKATEIQKGYIGAAYAYRAMLYLDLARMYEYLPTDGTKMPNLAGNDVTGLTVPIVTETTTEEQAKNNPRVTREKMAEFILSDLQAAEKYIVNLTESSHILPHLDAVYGLMARYYMWLAEDANGNSDIEAYKNAQKYARLAITESNLAPMTQEECLSTSKGFNNINCWMWGAQLVKENDLVQTGIINWTSWKSNETSFGYAGAYGAQAMIDASMYNRIDDNDFRKRLWKAPNGSPLSGKNEYVSSAYMDFSSTVKEYGSLKFRPGEGNADDVNLTAATAYPLMRVEEMYFIEAEAAEHVAPGTGKALLESFMNNYRIADDVAEYTYSCTNSNVIDEIVFQKRVELWGEGLTFFDVKRLDMSVTRDYQGSNWKSLTNFNTSRRPAWMNYCIVATEKNSNSALVGYENPDPSQAY